MTNSQVNGSRTSHNIRAEDQQHSSNTVTSSDQRWDQPIRNPPMNRVVEAPRARFAHIKDLQLRAQYIVGEYGSHLPVGPVSLWKPAIHLRSHVLLQDLLTERRCGSSWPMQKTQQKESQPMSHSIVRIRLTLNTLCAPRYCSTSSPKTKTIQHSSLKEENGIGGIRTSARSVNEPWPPLAPQPPFKTRNSVYYLEQSPGWFMCPMNPLTYQAAK